MGAPLGSVTVPLIVELPAPWPNTRAENTTSKLASNNVVRATFERTMTNHLLDFSADFLIARAEWLQSPSPRNASSDVRTVMKLI
jgi:hypothetical protein